MTSKHTQTAWRGIPPNAEPTLSRGGAPGAVTLFAWALLLTVVPAPLWASSPLQIPLRLDYITLTAAINQQLYTMPGGGVDLWQGLNSCQYLIGQHPRFLRSPAGTLRLETEANFSFGAKLAEICVSPIQWQGIIAADVEPRLTPEMVLKLHVIDLNLYDLHHGKTFIVGRGFDLIKQYFIPRIETFAFDLAPPVKEVAALIEEAAPPLVAQRVKQALSTVRSAPAIGVQGDALKVTLLMELPEFAAAPTPAPGATAAPLTAEEIRAWQDHLDRWDAFMVFAVKQLGLTVGDKEFRERLLDLLLSSRYRLVTVISSPQSGGADPVRMLFLEQWGRLNEIVKSAAQRDLLGSRTLEFLSFVSAGDALYAFDQAAPALGVRISEGDLRRLAHIMAPNIKTDPLKFDFEEDPELQDLFGIPRPLSIPGALPSESAPPGPAAAPAPSSSPPGPGASGTCFADGLTAFLPADWRCRLFASADSILRSFRWWIAPGDALAAESNLGNEIRALGAKLRRAVASQSNVDNYRSQIDRLLELSAEREAADPLSDPRSQRLYVLIVKSAAWQESCWRQFVMHGSRVRYLESSTGDLGLMQVNRHVWRGLYSIRRLEWDIVYNAGAGSEILRRLMRFVLSKQISPGAGDDRIARSVYAAYNGGPDDYARWRRDEPARLRQIDSSFWAKYQTLQRGQSFDIVRCQAEWGREPTPP